MNEYTFGDSELARERLAIVADAFTLPTRALLAEIPAERPRYVLDLGCGPGYTTALLAERFPDSFVTGLDSSPAMVTEARERVPDAHFAVADVTARLQLPADLVYARLVLGHLPAPDDALNNWARSLRGGGLLVCEEPVRYRSDPLTDPNGWFDRYERAVTAVVAATGAHLWAAAALDVVPAGCTRAIDRVVLREVPVDRAAGMFWRNAVQWRDRSDDAGALIAHFRELEGAASDQVLIWEIRQATYVKNPA